MLGDWSHTSPSYSRPMQNKEQEVTVLQPMTSLSTGKGNTQGCKNPEIILLSPATPQLSANISKALQISLTVPSRAWPWSHSIIHYRPPKPRSHPLEQQLHCGEHRYRVQNHLRLTLAGD